MNIPDTDLIIERTTGQGPGGQARNRQKNCIRITHVPTGIIVTEDGRNQHQNLRKAKKTLIKRIKEAQAADAAAAKKAERDRKVRESPRVRTYDQSKNRVTDHRTNMKRTFDDVVKRGNIQDFLDDFLADL